MKKLNYILYLLTTILITSCYEGYENDYETSYTYFASQQPLRTVVADTDMSISVGVAIGGKREVDPNDWATFVIDETLLDPYSNNLHIMPSSYYQLADSERMVIDNLNLAIADVEITFTDDFYNDNNSYTNYYAIPFLITDHNQDEITLDANGVAKDYSIVVINAVSQYHGTYYVLGERKNLQTDEVEVYCEDDLSQNRTCDIISLGRNKIQRTGFDIQVDSSLSINLTIEDNGSVTIESGCETPITNAIAILEPAEDSLDFVDPQPKFTLVYSYEMDNVEYKVTEQIIRRQNPEDDLRFQEWSFDVVEE